MQCRFGNYWRNLPRHSRPLKTTAAAHAVGNARHQASSNKKSDQAQGRASNAQQSPSNASTTAGTTERLKKSNKLPFAVQISKKSFTSTQKRQLTTTIDLCHSNSSIAQQQTHRTTISNRQNIKHSISHRHWGRGLRNTTKSAT